MFSFFKKNTDQIAAPTVTSANQSLGETEQKTPKAGYVLLLAMVIVSLFFGWRAIDDLQNVPQKPEALSHCSNGFLSYEWEDYARFGDGSIHDSPIRANWRTSQDVYEQVFFDQADKGCIFSHLEIQYGVPAVFERRKSFDTQLKNFSLGVQQLDNSIGDYERQYNLGLQEKIAEEQQKLYPIDVIQKNLEPLRKQKAALEVSIDKVRADLKKVDEQLKDIYKNLLPDYRKEWRWYEFKVFILEAIFVVPFFWLVFSLYRRLLYRKSPYTIIFTALLGVASVLLVRIFLVWFWNLFLARIVQALWNYIQNFALLKSIVFYFGMGLSIAVFGGAVYLLQKHLFDPKRVALRALKHNKCPQCEFSLDIAEDYCPNCGRHIREKCPTCGHMRFVDFPSCPRCGSKNKGFAPIVILWIVAVFLAAGGVGYFIYHESGKQLPSQTARTKEAKEFIPKPMISVPKKNEIGWQMYRDEKFQLSIPPQWHKSPRGPGQLILADGSPYYLNFDVFIPDEYYQDKDDSETRVLYASGKLLETEQAIINSLCSQVGLCGEIVESKSIAVSGGIGIEFIVPYKGLSIQEPQGFSNEIHRTILKDGIVYRFWTSEKSAPDDLKNKYPKLDPSPTELFRKILDTFKTL